MTWTSYKDFDESVGFSSKAGFQLTPKQIDKIEEMLQWQKLLNKLEVGCGKTVTATVVSLMQGYAVTTVTVPPILITSWVSWLTQVSENVVAYRGDPKERAQLASAVKSARWVVCSHAIFRKDYETLFALTRHRKRELIVDEAHAYKNPKSVLFAKAKDYTAGDAGHQALTGTPISKPLDAYSYIKLKTPSMYRSYTAFENLHVAQRDFFKNPTEYANLDLLAERLNLQSVSGTKEDMHGYDIQMLMPDCHYELHPDHYKLYEKLVDEQLLEFDDGSVIDATTVQKLRQALQQVVVNWDYFSNTPGNRSAVFDMVDLTLEEIEVDRLDKSKLIIWTKYKRSSKKLWDYCAALGIKTVAAYGDSNSEEAVQKFMNDESTRILVAQPQSAGAGLNPQHVCSEALFVEIDTVPIYARQALGRIDRIGQKRIPRAKIAVARNTVQEGLWVDLLKKDDVVQQIEPTKRSIRQMLLGGTQ